MNKKLKLLAVLAIFLFSGTLIAQTTPNDGDWKKNNVVLKNTPQAELMIRLGDIDNLGFGWEQGFDPFCGLSTPAHSYPWKINPADVKGMDRILLPSSYVPNAEPNGADGYSGAFDKKTTTPAPIDIDLLQAKGMTINKILIQIFVDDFQSPRHSTRFQAKVNGTRFKELEQILNALDQTGPIGKIISIEVPDYLIPEFQKEKVSFLIDDPITGAGDGFAIDFIKLLFNFKPYAYLGFVSGNVINEDGEPINGALVATSNKLSVKTNSEGNFKISNVYAGLNIIHVSANGYMPENVNVDIICSGEQEGVEIQLKKKKLFVFNGQSIGRDDALPINNIQFKLNSFEILPEANAELDKIAQFLLENPSVFIELSGHTSSEGDAQKNVQLSKDRVNYCKKYLTKKGIDDFRIVAIGFGAEIPVAPNDTEENKVKNRRVEMKILRY
jgi:OmpA-OmpF porin, OOP family